MLHMSNTVQKIEGSALTPGAFSHTLCLDSDKEISTQLPKNTSNYSPLAPKLESILQHLPLSSHAGEQLTRGMRYVPYSYDNLLGQIKSHMPSSPHSPATGSCDFEHDLRAAELRQIWRKQHTRSSSQGSLGCSPPGLGGTLVQPGGISVYLRVLPVALWLGTLFGGRSDVHRVNSLGPGGPVSEPAQMAAAPMDLLAQHHSGVGSAACYFLPALGVELLPRAPGPANEPGRHSS